MAAKAVKNNIPEETLALYDKLVKTIPSIEKKGASMPYTSLNGHMFTFIAADGTLAIRLPEDVRNEFISKYKTQLMEVHGMVMKEYVAVPATLLSKTKELAKYLKASFEYIQTLKPKATKK